MLGIPERDENWIKASRTNAILKAAAERNPPKNDVEVKRDYHSVKSFTFGQCYFKVDKIQLSNDGWNDIKNLIKGKTIFQRKNDQSKNL